MVDPARILVVSGSYGGGHDQVAHAVREAITCRNPSCDVRIADYVEFVSAGLDQVTRTLYTFSLRRFPRGYKLFYRLTDDLRSESLVEHALNGLGKRRLLAAIRLFRPDAILVTFPLAVGVIADLHAENGLDTPIFTLVTDYAVHGRWIHRGVDHYFVGSAEVADGVRDRGIEPSRISVTGIPIRDAFRHRPTKEQARATLRLDPDLPTLLVMGGALGMLGNTVGTCTGLGTALDVPCQIIIVGGRNETLVARLRDAVATVPHPVRVLGFVDDIPTLMSAADLLVTKAGGVTVSEALACGLPMVLYKVLPGHEEANAALLEQHMAAVQARTPDALVSTTKHLLTHGEARAAMKEAASNLGRPAAAEEVAQAILSSVSTRFAAC